MDALLGDRRFVKKSSVESEFESMAAAISKSYAAPDCKPATTYEVSLAGEESGSVVLSGTIFQTEKLESVWLFSR